MGGLRRIALVVRAVEPDGGGHRFSVASFRILGGASCGDEYQHPDRKAAHRRLFLGQEIRSRGREPLTALMAGTRNCPPVHAAFACIDTGATLRPAAQPRTANSPLTLPGNVRRSSAASDC